MDQGHDDHESEHNQGNWRHYDHCQDPFRVNLDTSPLQVKYTAKYRLTYDDGFQKIVKDNGIMERVLKTGANAKFEGPFSLDDDFC